MDTSNNKVSWSVLKNPEFLKLWIGQIISYVGDRITQMALLGWLIVSTQKTGSEMAKITFFSLLPAFLFGQFAGIVADRFSRKTVMIVSDLIRAGLVFLIALCAMNHGSSFVVYSIVFLAGVCTAFFYPAKLSLIPDLVDPEELQAANALSSGTGMIATLVGTYFAGVLIAQLGFTSGFFINGVTYLFSALAIWLIQPIEQDKTGQETQLLNELRDGWKYLQAHRRAWNLVILATFLSFLSSFFYISLTVLAVDHFKLGTEGVGRLLSMLGFGMILGAFLAVYLRKWMKLTHLVVASFLIIFITNFTAPVVQTYTMAWIWLTFLGAANSIILVTIDTLIQRTVPNRYRGKIFGFRSVLTNGVFLLSLLGVSQLLGFASPFSVLKVLALSSLFIALLILFFEQDFTYLTVQSLARFILKYCFGFEIEGQEHLRFQSKMILAGNHSGFLDSLILAAACERPIKFMVAQSVFSWPIVGWLVKQMGVIPVIKGKGEEAIQEAVDYLNRGRVVCIFPEGKLSRDGQIGKFHRGVAKIHFDSKAPIVSFSIYGGYEAWHWGQKLPKPHKIIVQFGQPIRNFDETEENLIQEIRERVQFMKESLERRERAKREQIYQESVLSLMQMKSDLYGSRTALALKDENKWNELSFSELSRQSRDLSDYLMEKGIKREERIAILSESRPEWGIAFFAAIRAGAITVPLDIKLTSAELVSILSNAEPAVLFVSTQFLEISKALKTLIPSIREIILLDAAKNEEVPYFKSLHATTSHEGRERDIDEVALIIYTSGTTGNPKGVMTSFRNLIFEIRNFEEILNLSSKDLFLSILPLNHLLELTGGFLGVLHAGGRICYSKGLHPQEIGRLMQEKKVTFMVTVPLFLKMLKGSIEKEIRRSSSLRQYIFKILFSLSKWFPSSPRLKKFIFSPIHNQFGGKLRGFICGGAPLELEVAEFFVRIGIPVYQGYGLTETSPVITVNTPTFNRLGSVGKSLPGVYVKIAKSSEEGEEGEIWTKGPHVMKGYYKQSDLTNEVIDESRWLHTGDIGKLDQDGFLYITGRIKNLIVLGGGKKVHPEEVEACLSRSLLFKEVCILGTHIKGGSKDGTEEVAAIVVPNDSLKNQYSENSQLQKEIEKEVEAQAQDLATYKRPSKIFVHLDDLPRTATRKIKRPLVSQWLDTLGK